MSDSRPIALDEIDRQLIALLQINARESVATLARQLGIARTTVNSRLERLEKHKVITGYGVRLGQRLIGGGLQAYVGIKVQPRSGKEVVRRLSAMGQVQQLCAVSGEFDYVAWLRSDSPEQLDQLLDQIGSVEGWRRPPRRSSSAARSIGAASLKRQTAEVFQNNSDISYSGYKLQFNATRSAQAYRLERKPIDGLPVPSNYTQITYITWTLFLLNCHLSNVTGPSFSAMSSFAVYNRSC